MSTETASVAPRRLLVAIDEMEVGGSQRQIVQLLHAIDRRRWSPELVYFRQPSFLVEQLRDTGIPVHHVAKRARIDPLFLLRLRGLLRRGRYDVVHAFSLTAELWALLATRFLIPRPRLVASIRGLYEDRSTRFWWLKRLVLRRSAAVIGNSRAGISVAARRCRMSETDFVAIGNGIDMPTPLSEAERLDLRMRVGVPEGRIFGVFVGRLVAVKNPFCLLDALARLPAPQRPWIALVGDGPLRDEIARRRHELGLDDDLTLLGERADARRLMLAADFLVLPSRSESLSNALLEAMAAGCPPLASAVGGTVEAIEHERTGLLFPDDDRIALSAGLRRLSEDAPLRRRLAAAARERVCREHAPSALAAATMAVYDTCLRDPAPNPEHRAPARIDERPERLPNRPQ